MRNIVGENFLEIAEVAKFLDVKVNTLYRMRSRKAFDVPSIKWGQQLYFKKQDVQEWFYARKKNVAEDTQLD